MLSVHTILGALAAMIGMETASAAASAPLSTKSRQAEAFDLYSACVADRSPGPAAELVLETGYQGDELRRRMNALTPALQACLRGQKQELLRISPYLLRGEMARALWLKGVSAPRRYVAPSAADAAGPNGEAARNEIVTATFAECLLDAAPDAAPAFVRALSGTQVEQAEFARMRAAANGCAVEGEKDLVLGGDRLRAALAIALFGQTAKTGAN